MPGASAALTLSPLQTRILVTHGISFLPRTDKIVVLVDGAVSEHGSYGALLASGGAFAQYLSTYGGQEQHKPEGQATSKWHGWAAGSGGVPVALGLLPEGAVTFPHWGPALC